MIAFGRLYISNPDLAIRFQNKYPLADLPPYETWWTNSLGPKGYIDWPTY